MVVSPGPGHLAAALSQTGHQRLWYWRGWRIRYWFHPAKHPSPQPPLLFIHGFGA
ncbi:MAG: hypothetical protein HC922_06235, partial [Leptolyngbyaceae cyanobacterium SM2_3_12]|nr:hypothetical protein [Leptolyngbyaceae cyanobacterium SM2_3_12]